jgi:hypothetical protein
MGATSNQRTITMKCVIITYQSGKTAVYLKSDPALLDEILHSNEWILELHEAEFVQQKPTIITDTIQDVINNNDVLIDVINNLENYKDPKQKAKYAIDLIQCNQKLLRTNSKGGK